MNAKPKQSGVTLVELLAVISMVAILMAIGVPSYRYVTVSNRVSGEINSLLGDLQYARYEAVKEGLPVTVCPAAATASTCAGGTAWGSGWIVLSNAAATGGTAAVLRRQLPFGSSNSTDTLVSSVAGSILFNREGFASALSGTGVTFTLNDPTNTSSFKRCLQVGLSGMMATAPSGASAVGVLC
jgi:type IV fimbrial biogenesis protein FimT